MERGGKLRVGIVDYLNAWPLAWGFLTGESGDGFEVTYLPPADVASELEAGRLDIGLIPSIELQRQRDLKVVPGLCVASTHEVQSVILVSRGPLEKVRRVALDRNSRTSAALVQVLLAERCGVRPEVTACSPDVEEMLASADAALIIGDPALRVDRQGLEVWDLAAEWRALTGRPFVFAVWAIRGDLGPREDEVGEVLTDSLEHGLEQLESVIDRAVQQLGLIPDLVRRYLTDNLSYRLDGDALAGLEEFHQRSARLGLIPNVEPLRFSGAGNA